MTKQTISLDDFLKHASLLISATASDAQNLQDHLSELLEGISEAFKPDFDSIVIQDLDRITQTLHDIALALANAKRCDTPLEVTDWSSTQTELKLQHVADALSLGRFEDTQKNEIEIF